MPTPSELSVVCEGSTRRLGVGGPLVSIILPVKNRAGNLQRLLPRLFGQRCDADVEVIAVDSGSDDATVPVLRDAGATVLAVPADRFSYGLTRTQASHAANGSMLVFVSSTVLPLDDTWLHQLLAPFGDERVAGAFSRSIPRPDADRLTFRDYLRADLTAYRSSEASVHGPSEIREITDWDRYRRLPPVELRRFISFSNNAAAIRASVFRQIPFRDHHICEDMLWAQEALEAGHRIVYQRSSIVLYSHTYDPIDFFGRCFDGGVFFSHSGGTSSDADVVPTIVQMVLDDWRYLAEQRSLTGEALEAQQAESVVRRAAEMFGQWLGIRHSTLHDLDGLRSLLLTLPASHGRAAVDALDRGLAAIADRISREDVEPSLRTAIATAWLAIAADRTTARIEAATLAALETAAFWFGRWWNDTGRRPLLEVFSLIERQRRGGRTLEMRQERSAAVPDGFDPAWRQYVDREALVLTIDALQAEYRAAHRELHARAEVMAALHSDVVARDATIRSLQSELMEKVGERDSVIRGLQKEMATKIAECNAIIASLQKSAEPR